jgi:hypothetical protein
MAGSIKGALSLVLKITCITVALGNVPLESNLVHGFNRGEKVVQVNHFNGYLSDFLYFHKTVKTVSKPFHIIPTVKTMG